MYYCQYILKGHHEMDEVFRGKWGLLGGASAMPGKCELMGKCSNVHIVLSVYLGKVITRWTDTFTTNVDFSAVLLLCQPNVCSTMVH
jgi:hypothetical protein